MSDRISLMKGVVLCLGKSCILMKLEIVNRYLEGNIGARSLTEGFLRYCKERIIVCVYICIGIDWPTEDAMLCQACVARLVKSISTGG